MPGTTCGGWRLSPARRAATGLCHTGANLHTPTSQHGAVKVDGKALQVGLLAGEAVRVTAKGAERG